MGRDHREGKGFQFFLRRFLLEDCFSCLLFYVSPFVWNAFFAGMEYYNLPPGVDCTYFGSEVKRSTLYATSVVQFPRFEFFFIFLIVLSFNITFVLVLIV